MASWPGNVHWKARAGLVVAMLSLLAACGDEKRDDPGTVATAPVPASPASPAAGVWSTGAPLPTPRSEVASAVLDGRIYVIGGFDAAGRSTAVVEVYDVAADRWQRRASLPEVRDHPMAAAFEGRVYVFGGAAGSATRSVFAYDPASDRWQRLADMPNARTAGGAAVLGDRIVVVGGTGERPSETMVYHPASGQWRIGADFRPREHLAVMNSGGRVYAIGGRWEGELSARNEVLERADGSWRELAPMPTARGGTAGDGNGRLVAVAGGEAFGPNRTFAEVEVYEPASDKWSRAPDLPTPRHGLAVRFVGDRLFVIGGGPTAGLSVSPQNEVLELGR